jgi:diguanylate cyclase (GGDEF)-like protein/PAS domain S-box-containing protein
MSLRFKFLIPLVIACLISAAYISLVWVPNVIRDGERQYLSDVGAHLDTAIEGLIPLILSSQLDLIRRNLDELRKKNRDWLYIRLTNAEDKWLYPPLVESEDKPPFASRDVQVVSRNIRYLGAPIGKLVVYVDLASRLDKLRASQYRLMEILSAIVTMFALTLVGTLEFSTVRRLRRLTSATSELARHQFDFPLPKGSSDEIGGLISNFEVMRTELKTYRENLLHEVEERRQREQDLEQYKAIVESSDDAIIGKTLSGTITSWNPGAERMFGYSASEAIGQPSLMLVPSEQSDEEMEILSSVAHGEKIDHFETVWRHKDGRLVDISASICPILDETGTPVGISRIARDIGERKHLEAEQQAATLQLETQLQKISELQARLQEQVIHDPLTGLFNRRYLDETMPRELALAKREGYLLTVVMLDLDHFKMVNDTYGHAAGDEVLKAVANLLTEKGRESDIICRYGGEEFVVVLPRLSPVRAISRVEEWRTTLMNTKIKHGDLEISITLSAGIAGYPENGSDPDTLISHADQALYYSKDQGRNKVTRFQDISHMSVQFQHAKQAGA